MAECVKDRNGERHAWLIFLKKSPFDTTPVGLTTNVVENSDSSIAG